MIPAASGDDDGVNAGCGGAGRVHPTHPAGEIAVIWQVHGPDLAFLADETDGAASFDKERNRDCRQISAVIRRHRRVVDARTGGGGGSCVKRVLHGDLEKLTRSRRARGGIERTVGKGAQGAVIPLLLQGHEFSINFSDLNLSGLNP